MQINTQTKYNNEINIKNTHIRDDKNFFELIKEIDHDKLEFIRNNSTQIKKIEKKLSSSEDRIDVTDDSKYKNASEYKAFIKKWMDKGYTDTEAMSRANFYAIAGLLNYGEQTLIPIDFLGPGKDKQQHGLHLINNHTLKSAILKTFDSLDTGGVAVLVMSLFVQNVYTKSISIRDYENTAFQNLIDDFALRLEKEGGLYNLDKEKYSKYENRHFDGNINITGLTSQVEKNFIYDILIELFKNQSEKISKPEDEYTVLFDIAKNAFNVLIENFQEEIKEENTSYNILNEYTKNNKPMPY